MKLQSHIISGRSAGPHLLITGGVHGDEFESMVAIRELIQRIPAAQLRGRVTLVPVVNEPAFRRGTRTAEDEKDLARTCPGRADGTITEQIAFALSALIQSANFYIDLHTGGTRLQVHPMTGYVLHKKPDVLAVQRRMAKAFGLPIIWGTDPTLPGRSLSIARDADVPAIYTEYLGGGGCDPVGVAAYVQGCLNVLSALDMLAQPPTPPSTEPLVIEDHRPSSGHMQINLPSPIDGYFAPTVKLGQRVQLGELLGTVSNTLGTRVESILAPHRGVVLVLHSFPSVTAGECLGVVMECGD